MALSPMFSPTHITYTGDQIEMICESEGIDTLYMKPVLMVTYRSITMSVWTVSKETFEGLVADPQDYERKVRRYAPIVGR